jgi:hypothetical protein
MCTFSYKNEKSVDLSITFQISKSIGFYYFCVAQNKKEFVLWFRMLVEYIIDKVQNFFQFFKTYKYDF